MTDLWSLLYHPLKQAARDIMDLSVPLAGKNKAVEVRALPALVTLLQDKATDVRAKAAGAIMTITITTQVEKLGFKSRMSGLKPQAQS